MDDRTILEKLEEAKRSEEDTSSVLAFIAKARDRAPLPKYGGQTCMPSLYVADAHRLRCLLTLVSTRKWRHGPVQRRAWVCDAATVLIRALF